MPRIGFFHHDDAPVLAKLPGELSPADVHGINLRRAVLEQAIGEAAGGRAEVERDQPGHVELKMFERVFEFVAAAADVFFAGVEREGVIGPDRVAGFAGGPGVDADLAGEDGAFGLFAAFAKAAFNQRLIEAGHGIDRRKLSSKAATVTSGGH